MNEAEVALSRAKLRPSNATRSPSSRPT